MPTDYVLFIHGVNTRQPTYADTLVHLINHAIPIKSLVVFWGNLADKNEAKLLQGCQASGIWDKLWFRELREGGLLRSAGDVALYLSRRMGAQVADKVAEKLTPLSNCTMEDCLHLVTHSLGTVILFDLMFSSRWDDDRTVGHDSVMTIRRVIYGLDPYPEQGIRLGSITTMGSPISLFSLMDVQPPAMDIKCDPHEAASTHDITPGFVHLLDCLHQVLAGSKLPWCNFVHPGDPIACPLEGILPSMVDEQKTYIDIQDRLIPTDFIASLKEPLPQGLLDLLAGSFSQNVISILDSGYAHNSYWESSCVVDGIVQLIKRARA